MTALFYLTFECFIPLTSLIGNKCCGSKPPFTSGRFQIATRPNGRLSLIAAALALVHCFSEIRRSLCNPRSADLEICDTADLEVCATEVGTAKVQCSALSLGASLFELDLNNLGSANPQSHA